MHMRLQTSRKPAKEALSEGLDKVANICDEIDAAFDAALQSAMDVDS